MCFAEKGGMTELWAGLCFTQVSHTWHWPFPANPIGSASPYFNLPQTTECSPEGHPRLSCFCAAAQRKPKQPQRNTRIPVQPWKRCSGTGRDWELGQSPSLGDKEWLHMALLEMGLIPLLWEVFSKLDDLRCCWQGWRGLECESGQLSMALPSFVPRDLCKIK